MNKKNPNGKTIKNWTSLAEYDLETAKAMLKSGRYVYVAFTCQQAIEKLLKAIYVKRKNGTPPYTHNLTKLVDDAGVLSELSVPHRQLLETLNLYYIQSRYAEHIDRLASELSKTAARSLLKETEILYAWLKGLL